MKLPNTIKNLVERFRLLNLNGQEIFEEEETSLGSIMSGVEPIDEHAALQAKRVKEDELNEFTLNERKLIQKQYEQHMLDKQFKYGTHKDLKGKVEIKKDYFIGGALYKIVNTPEGKEVPVYCSRYNAFTKEITIDKNCETDKDVLKANVLSLLNAGHKQLYLSTSRPEEHAVAYLKAAYKVALENGHTHDSVHFPRAYRALKESLRADSSLSGESKESTSVTQSGENYRESKAVDKPEDKPTPESSEETKSEESNPNGMFLVKTKEEKYLVFLTNGVSKLDDESLRAGFKQLYDSKPELLHETNGAWSVDKYSENVSELLENSKDAKEAYDVLITLKTESGKKPAKKATIDEMEIIAPTEAETQSIQETAPTKKRQVVKPKRC